MEDRVHLSPRLRTIMALVPQGALLADIGTDHALLPVALLKQGKITSAIASDIRQGPLARAARTVRQFAYEDAVSLRLGSGLTTVQPEEADTIVLAGMGGETMIGVLEHDQWALDGTHLLLLQAMTGKAALRQYLAAHGGSIEQEIICREGNRFYTIMAVRGGGQPKFQTLEESEISQALCRDAMSAVYLKKCLEKEQKICAALQSANQQRLPEQKHHQVAMQVIQDALQRCQDRTGEEEQ